MITLRFDLYILIKEKKLSYSYLDVKNKNNYIGRLFMMWYENILKIIFKIRNGKILRNSQNYVEPVCFKFFITIVQVKRKEHLNKKNLSKYDVSGIKNLEFVLFKI